jgi:putative heme iron utilization protein
MNQHAAPAPSGPQAPEPSHAERVRTLLAAERLGTLATHSQKHPGFPFASVMPYALHEGAPVFLVSSMALHTQNFVADPRASLLVMQSGADADPLGAPRATLLGRLSRVDATDAMRATYLERHPSSRYWIDFDDFSFYRLEVAEVYFVGGFGVMGWVAVSDFAGAEPDPLMPYASGILAHMNADHGDALRSIVKHFAGLEADEATMVSCDRLGFVVRARTAAGMKGARIAFPEEVRSSEDARRVLVAMTREARG